MSTKNASRHTVPSSWKDNPWVWVLSFERVETQTSGGKPILFSGEMVRAILEGRKTQTRRTTKPQPHPDFLARGLVGGIPVPQWPQQNGVRWFMADGLSELTECPYGKPGDTLWVRETWAWPGE